MISDFDRYNATIDVFSKSDEPKLQKSFLCFKIILLATNLVFLIFALVLIIAGAYALNSKANAFAGQSLPGGIIAVGVFTLLLSALGAVASWKESRFLLSIYFILLLCIVIIMFSIGVAILVNKGNSEKYIVDAWNAAPPDLITAAQLDFSCCGLRTTSDSTVQCPSKYTGPCLPVLKSAWEKVYNVSGSIGLAFSIIMGVAIFLVISLMKGIKKFQQEKRKFEEDKTAAKELEDEAAKNDLALANGDESDSNSEEGEEDRESPRRLSLSASHS
jgi:hypothetical protein